MPTPRSAITPPAPALPAPPRIPSSTYRLQFGPNFGFRDALDVVPYLHRLGVTDLYASPIFAARPGSTHGYDVTDPTRLSPALGADDDFSALADALASNAMGLLLDIVPNHMAAHHDNPWWWDVLQNGRASRYAEFFDIHWDDDPDGRIVLPVLGAAAEDVLARDELTLGIDPSRGVVLRYFDHLFPIDPALWAPLLLPHAADLAAALGSGSPGVEAMTRLLARAGPLPSRSDPHPASLAKRAAGVDEIKAALRDILAADPVARVFLENALAAASRAREHNVLSPIASILDQQAYRLAYWKRGLERINYRRFFDIADLVSLRADRPEVFDVAHTLTADLIARGSVTGLRVDHIDGLADPHAYLDRLAALAGGDTLIVVEKILAPGEPLPTAWPCAGTTGYDFLNAAGRVLIDPGGAGEILAHAQRTLQLHESFDEAAYDAKRFVIAALFPAELRSLTDHLARLAAAAGPSASGRDLSRALAATTAAMGVYRTYLRPGVEPASDTDRARIKHALAAAIAREGGDPAAYDLLRRALIPDGAPTPDQHAFIQRWQQFTGPVMAKGVEDTALYRHITLAGLSEVGGEPVVTPDPVTAFHDFNLAAASSAPPAEAQRAHHHSLNATSTHDTKRSEDARARLAVLSEIPERWIATLDRWRGLNAPCKAPCRDGPAPSAAAESLIYQSLIAIWPLAPEPGKNLTARVRTAMIKSAKEAKLETSWGDPDAEYEAAIGSFIEQILGGRPSSPFLTELLALVRDIAPAGALNALAQLTLKLASPGIPDFYQGSELWNLSLVDPDNRRPVNFARRESALAELERHAAGDPLAILPDLLNTWRDGRIKLFATWRGLHARRDHRDLFAHGAYIPLTADGPQRDHIIALARRQGDEWAIAIAPRLTLKLSRDPGSDFPLGAAAWTTTTVPLPTDAPTTWRNAFTGEAITAIQGRLPLAPILRHHPTALLLSAHP